MRDIHRRTNINAAAALVLSAMYVSPGLLRAQDAADPAAAEEPARRVVVDPTVEALLETNPSTPAEMVRLARILVDLNAATAAKGLIERIIVARPDAEALADLSDRFGTATFLRFKQIEELNPEATQLADAVLAAATQRAADPGRIAGLIAQLQDPDPDQRRAAVELLRSGRSTSVNALIAVLADAVRATEHENVKTAIVGLRLESVGPLLGALETPEARLKTQVVEILGRIGDGRASDYLLAAALAPDEPDPVRSAAQSAILRLEGRLPRPADAAMRLYRRAAVHYAGQQPLGPVIDGRADQEMAAALAVELWSWDPVRRQAVVHQHVPADASVVTAFRLARDARRLASDDPSIRRLYLGALLEATTMRGRLEQPLPEGPGTPFSEVSAEGVDVVNDLLDHSAATGHPAAAAAAARILGRIADVDLLYHSGAAPCPLVQAARHPDRRVRFAAVEAIMAIDPIRPYPGSSYVLNALEFFLRSSGRPLALVAGQNSQQVQRQAGMLTEMGYRAQAVFETAGVQRAAIASPDYELLLIDLPMAWPTSGELIQRIRRDGRTAKLPIAIVARLEEQDRAERLARRFDLVEAIIRPPDPAALAFQISPLLARRAGDYVGPRERLRQAEGALDWADLLCSDTEDSVRRRLYELSRLERTLIGALWVPRLSQRAAEVLANLGTPSGQRALVDLASRNSQPIGARRASADAFGQSVSRHGILLTTSEMLRQFDRYNQSELLDRNTQAVLGSILDTLQGQTVADK